MLLRLRSATAAAAAVRRLRPWPARSAGAEMWRMASSSFSSSSSASSAAGVQWWKFWSAEQFTAAHRVEAEVLERLSTFVCYGEAGERKAAALQEEEKDEGDKEEEKHATVKMPDAERGEDDAVAHAHATAALAAETERVTSEMESEENARLWTQRHLAETEAVKRLGHEMELVLAARKMLRRRRWGLAEQDGAQDDEDSKQQQENEEETEEADNADKRIIETRMSVEERQRWKQHRDHKQKQQQLQAAREDEDEDEGDALVRELLSPPAGEDWVAFFGDLRSVAEYVLETTPRDVLANALDAELGSAPFVEALGLYRVVLMQQTCAALERVATQHDGSLIPDQRPDRVVEQLRKILYKGPKSRVKALLTIFSEEDSMQIDESRVEQAFHVCCQPLVDALQETAKRVVDPQDAAVVGPLKEIEAMKGLYLRDTFELPTAVRCTFAWAGRNPDQRYSRIDMMEALEAQRLYFPQLHRVSLNFMDSLMTRRQEHYEQKAKRREVTGFTILFVLAVAGVDTFVSGR